MPEIGEIRGARELGYKGTARRIWVACEICGKERWVTLRFGKPKDNRCRSCGARLNGIKYLGKSNPSWKGGRHPDCYGYIIIKLEPSDLFYPMVDHAGYVREHRLVIAKHLGRCLRKDEIVHHLNGIRYDNRIRNLALVSKGNHQNNTLIRLFKKRIRDLEDELSQRKLWQP